MSIDRIKRRAKVIKRETGIKHMAALDVAAKEVGFDSYKQALIQAKRDLTEAEKTR